MGALWSGVNGSGRLIATAGNRAVSDSDCSPATPLSQVAPCGPEALRPHLAMGLPCIKLIAGACARSTVCIRRHHVLFNPITEQILLLRASSCGIGSQVANTTLAPRDYLHSR
jgi:hypothetical protein